MADLPGGSYTFTDLPDNVTVGKYSSIAGGGFYQKSDNHLCVENRKVVWSNNYLQTHNVEPIVIGSDVWIGQGVRVLQGVTIGDGAIIGAGAVIGKDVPPYAVVVGNPQVIKRYRFTKPQIKKLLEIKWWDWKEADIEKARASMKDITEFLRKYAKTT